MNHELRPFTSVGVDYLTVTAVQTGHKLQMAGLASALFKQQEEAGHESRPFSMKGFEGYQCGGVQIGRDDERVLVRLSSDMAHYYWRRIYEVSDTTSRIDVQCTTRTQCMAERRIARAFATANRYVRRQAKATNIKRVWSNKSGTTFYLGSRLSNAYGRVYNKGLESGDSQMREAVRYEVEFHKKAATFVAHSLYSSTQPSIDMIGYVSGFFTKRRVELEGVDANDLTFCLSRRRTTDDKRLRWLSEQVKPSVKTLVDHGKLEEVLSALGLAQIIAVVDGGPSWTNWSKN